MNTNKLFIHKYNEVSYLIMTYFTGSTMCPVVMKFCSNSQAKSIVTNSFGSKLESYPYKHLCENKSYSSVACSMVILVTLYVASHTALHAYTTLFYTQFIHTEFCI